MRIPLFFLFLLMMASAFSQPYTEFQEVGDWNGDGSRDSLYGYHDSGSGFAGGGVVLINGASHDTLEMVTTYCFCAVRNLHPVPDKLLLPENAAFFEKMKEVLRIPPLQPADPILQWITFGLEHPIPTQNSSYFERAFFSPIQWYRALPKPNASYAILISDHDFNVQVYSSFGEWPDTTAHQTGILTFSHYPLFSDSIEVEPSAPSGDWKIWAGKHFLQVRHGKEWAWAFVTDFQLTGGPEKMRWKSISEVFHYGKYVIVLVDMPPLGIGNWWVMNLEDGKYGQLATYDGTTVEIDGPFLKFRDEKGVPQNWDIQAIFKELDQLR